jgi:hypothetical protein
VTRDYILLGKRIIERIDRRSHFDSVSPSRYPLVLIDRDNTNVWLSRYTAYIRVPDMMSLILGGI